MQAYYTSHDGRIVLYCADMRDVLPTLADHSVGLVLTDPPFEAEAHTLQRRQLGVMERTGQRSVDSRPLPFAAITDVDRCFVSRECARIAARWTLTFCQVEAAPTWRRAYEAAGFTYRRTCIWVKPDGMPQYSGDRPGMGYETFVAMHPPGKSRWNGGGRHGVFTEMKARHDLPIAHHPTEKPIGLARELVSLFSDPDEIVLDPFAGSGTFLRAAADLGRQAIGVEINEQYAEIAAKRLMQVAMPLG